MSKSTTSAMSTSTLPVTAGIDLGDRKSRCCVVDASGTAVYRGSVAMDRQAVDQMFRRLGRKFGVERVVLEVGSHSPWVSEHLLEMGFEVFVANPRKVQLISKGTVKNDGRDAKLLARLGRSDPELLSPIRHRGPEARADLALLRSRSVLVDTRTKLINHVRGSLKPWGTRLSEMSTDTFHKKVREELSAKLPKDVCESLLPVVDLIEGVTEKIRAYDKQAAELCKKYPETGALMQVKGVGPLTALTFVLTIESPDVIDKTRNVGAYLGLVPRRSQSGEHDPQLRITKAGDRNLRRLLVQCAHYILGSFGKDSDLRRLGERIASDGNKGSKKRAAIAVARKLSVVLLSLWKTGEVYDPLRNSRARGEVEDPSTSQTRTNLKEPVLQADRCRSGRALANAVENSGSVTA